MIGSRKYIADFTQLEKVFLRQQPDRPVLFEYFVNGELISFVNGEDFSSLSGREDQIKSIISFFHKTGYDYATIPSRYFDVPSFSTSVHERKETASQNEGFVITDQNSFEIYCWPDMEKAQYNILEKTAPSLVDGMKFIVSGPGGLLENVINLVGFENLCFMIYENEELVRLIVDQVGNRLLRFYELSSSVKSVGALIVNDDWGFKSQTMFSPDFLRQFIFPWNKRMVEAIHRNRKFAILHSCGNLSDVFGDIIDDMNFDAKHSFEDNILPVEQAYALYHDRIAILGGIDMDFLVRSNPVTIGDRCRKLLEFTAMRAYALGSGNSIPSYVPMENYFAMVKATNLLN